MASDRLTLARDDPSDHFGACNKGSQAVDGSKFQRYFAAYRHHRLGNVALRSRSVGSRWTDDGYLHDGFGRSNSKRRCRRLGRQECK